jgi:hypothetical protein
MLVAVGSARMVAIGDEIALRHPAECLEADPLIRHDVDRVGRDLYRNQPSSFDIHRACLRRRLPVSALDFKDPLQFWDLLSDAMNENPPPQDQIKALLPSFKPLGIELGKQWDRSTVSPEVLADMKKAAANIGPMLANLPFGSHYQGAGPFYLIPRAYAPPPETMNILSDPTSWPVPAAVEVK